MFQRDGTLDDTKISTRGNQHYPKRKPFQLVEDQLFFEGRLRSCEDCGQEKDGKGPNSPEPVQAKTSQPRKREQEKPAEKPAKDFS